MSTNPGDSSTGPPDQATYAEPSHQWELKEKFAGFMGESGQLVKHRKTSVLMMYWDQDCTDFHVEEEVQPAPRMPKHTTNRLLTIY